MKPPQWQVLVAALRAARGTPVCVYHLELMVGGRRIAARVHDARSNGVPVLSQTCRTCRGSHHAAYLLPAEEVAA